MTRPVTEEGLKQQVALMTGEMFDAVRRGDKKLFDMAVGKGADVHARNSDGLPLLHAGVRRAIQEQRYDWLMHVLPYVDDLFVKNSKGNTLFDAKADDQLIPFRSDDHIAMLRKCRVKVMEEMPDIETARAQLCQQTEGPAQERVIYAPRFNAVVSQPERIEKPVSGDAPPPPKPGHPSP